MTASQKLLITKLLTGHFLRKMKRGKSYLYVLYDAKINPIQKINSRTVEKIDRFIDPKIKLWKKNKNGDISLNLSSVRQLHGRSTIKKLYKHREQLQANGAIYKTRKKKAVKTKNDEKIYYLF